MYYNHIIRTNIQQWRNQLYKSNYDDFADDLMFFYNKVIEEVNLNVMLMDITNEYPISDEVLDEWMEQLHYNQVKYKNEKDRLSYFIHMFFYFAKRNDSPANYLIFHNKNMNDSIREFLDRIITPILNYLHDSLDEISTLVYILEKYKLRTEWFTKDILRDKYRNVLNRQYEQVLEDDIRLYLFDQGIDYPFSTPKSASGRADIVSLVNTEDPLVMEIKIYDSEKKYGKERIISGFTQIVKYANDYHKNVGYLVVFNLDEIEIEIENIEPDNKFPNRVIFNGKTYYIIVVNLNYDTSASNLKKLNKVTIPYNELTSLKV